jgi:subtilisin-like proprotein convertase family protein
LIDAKKAVVKASCFDNLPQERVITRSLKANESGDLSFFVDEDMVVEYVQLEIVTKKGYINDSKLSLISPDGTSSQLLQSTVDSGDRVKSWEFGTMAFMDERSQGEWQIGVEPGVKIKSATLKIFGHQK